MAIDWSTSTGRAAVLDVLRRMRRFMLHPGITYEESLGGEPLLLLAAIDALLREDDWSLRDKAELLCRFINGEFERDELPPGVSAILEELTPNG